MSLIDDIRARLPETAKDTKLNLQRVLEPSTLNMSQTMLVALACGYAVRHRDLVSALVESLGGAALEEGISADQVKGDAIAAASLMAMNNVFYRFRHLVESPEYEKAPAALRMNHIAKPLTSKLHFELASIAVSAINGCGICVKSHDASIREHGGISSQVLDAIRIAAVISATATALE